MPGARSAFKRGYPVPARVTWTYSDEYYKKYTHTFDVEIGDQVYVGHDGEEVGAIKQIARDHVVIYIENGGDFRIDGPEVLSANDGKLVPLIDLLDDTREQ